MPSTIVKLCSGDARAWRVNQPVWLDKDGSVARAVLPEEQDAISACLSRTVKVEQSFRQELELKKKQPQGPRHKKREPSARALFAFEVLWVGSRRIVNVYLGELRYATGREVLSARLLADHGECILHGPNGKCMGVLRDPFILERAGAVGRRVQWSKNPDEEAKVEARRKELEERQSRAELQRASRRLHAPKTTTTTSVFSPAQCPNDCRGLREGKAWAIAKGTQEPGPDEHHPICMHADAWATASRPADETMMLFDIETSTVMREALPDEVEQSKVNRERTSVAQVQLQGRIFAVLTAADARAAAREARGEDPNEPAVSSGGSSETLMAPNAGSPSVAAGDRSDWPLLSELTEKVTGPFLQRRDHVTAADYLARTTTSAPGAAG